MTYINSLNHNKKALALLLLALGTFVCGCSIEQDVQPARGEAGKPTWAEHVYDPVSDAVVSWRLGPGQTVGQSIMTPPEGASLRGLRLKLLRTGIVPPLRLRMGSVWGGDKVFSGEIPQEQVSLFFERWSGVDLSQAVALKGETRYYLQLEVPEGGDTGHYEIFGTSTAPIDDPKFVPRYQYTPGWGKGTEVSVFENPINLDYGAETPRYPGGIAIGPGGEELEAMDLAFQLSSHLSPDEREASAEERFTFVEEELLAPVHRKRVAGGKLGAKSDGVKLDSSWRLLIPSQSGGVAQNAAADFRAFMKLEMETRIDLDTVSDFESPESYSSVLLAVTRKQWPKGAENLDRSESFSLDVSPERVVVCGFDERGLMRGLQHLEDLMRFQRGPVLEPLQEERSPLYTPRITAAPFFATMELDLEIDPYTHELLSRISHYGFSAIWIWGDLMDVGRSKVFPELDQGVTDRQRKLKEIADRAATHGLDVYVVLAHRPLPNSFFEKYPGVRGTPFEAYGGNNVLCTSTELVQQYIEESTHDLFRAVPDLNGVVFIVGGEGFIHCYTRNMNCPHCSSRSAQEVVAGLAKTISKGARAGRANAQVALWPYSASNHWSRKDITQSKLIGKLSPDVTFLTEFGKEGRITFGDKTIPAYDYPISYLGPSERFVAQAKLTEQHGVPLWVKTEHAIALETVQTPYIPVFQRWAERALRFQRFPHLTGIFANWMHYGFMPSIAAEIMKWHTWSPLPDTDDLLRRIARREFGEGTEEYALKAWQQWSEAIQHYPFSGRMAMGPVQKGPAHPLFLNPDYQPFHNRGRQFRNDLSWTEPWGVQVALKQFDLLLRGWGEGVRSWEKVVGAAAPELRRNARREGGVGAALLSCFRSAHNVGRFYQLRDQLAKEEQAPLALALLDQLKMIAEAELANSRQAVAVVAADSRLGYANSAASSHIGVPRAGIYTPGSIKKKIAQVERLLQEEIPEYRRRLESNQERAP